MFLAIWGLLGVSNCSFIPRYQHVKCVCNFVDKQVLLVLMETSRTIHVLDSHTEGEPTRVVISGGPNLGTGPLSQRLHRFATEFDSFRSGICLLYTSPSPRD